MGWDDPSLPLWSERVIVALPEDHPLTARPVVRWYEHANEQLLLRRRGPGLEFERLLATKLRVVGEFMDEAELDWLIRHMPLTLEWVCNQSQESGVAPPGFGPTEILLLMIWFKVRDLPG
jgi:hypothetical protein